MNKIIGIIRPFDINQTFLIYNDSQLIDTIKCSIQTIPETIFKVTKQYHVNEVNISGPTEYTNGIIKDFKEQELLKYKKNDIKFNFI